MVEDPGHSTLSGSQALNHSSCRRAVWRQCVNGCVKTWAHLPFPDASAKSLVMSPTSLAPVCERMCHIISVVAVVLNASLQPPSAIQSN